MIRYYFAAFYHRNGEMRKYRNALEEQVPNAQVVSRWLDQHEMQDTGFTRQYINEHPEKCWHFAQKDIEDMGMAQVIVSFTSTQQEGKGGRHVEFGYGLGTHRRMVIVGPRENIFHTLPRVEQYETFEDFLKHEMKYT